MNYLQTASRLPRLIELQLVSQICI